MLQKGVVEKRTLELLTRLCEEPILKHFALAGGTALALIRGHRKSIDLDFFTKDEFSPALLVQRLKNYSPTILNLDKGSVSCELSNTKVEFIRHDYPILNRFIEEHAIRLYSLEDIIAMKVNALINRGTKKDFFDIYEILRSYNLEDIFKIYARKYPKTSTLLYYKSLNYFEDAENEPDPISLVGVKWEQVKKGITNATKKAI